MFDTKSLWYVSVLICVSIVRQKKEEVLTHAKEVQLIPDSSRSQFHQHFARFFVQNFGAKAKM